MLHTWKTFWKNSTLNSLRKANNMGEILSKYKHSNRKPFEGVLWQLLKMCIQWINNKPHFYPLSSNIHRRVKVGKMAITALWSKSYSLVHGSMSNTHTKGGVSIAMKQLLSCLFWPYYVGSTVDSHSAFFLSKMTSLFNIHWWHSLSVFLGKPERKQDKMN